MPHSNKSSFALKHPKAKIVNTIQSKLQNELKENKISCLAAHKIATALEIDPIKVGIQIDLANYKITTCQLGLFGHEINHTKDIDFPVELESILEDAQSNNTISCLSCWEIADKVETARPIVSACCDKLKIRIKPCQLGAF